MLIRTPIGALAFSVSASGRQLRPDEVRFRYVQLEPHLPPGMAVDSVEAILVALEPHSALQAVNISCKWVHAPGSWQDRQSGECLDAQSWVVGNNLVEIGTEDFERLAGRLKKHGLRNEPYPISYCDDGFEILLPQVPANQLTSVHFIVASNHYPEPVECSAWYAVDVPHERIRAVAGEH